MVPPIHIPGPPLPPILFPKLHSGGGLGMSMRGHKYKQQEAIMAKKQIKINDLIFEKIKFRYHFVDEAYVHDRSRQNKMLLDSIYPSAVAKTIAGRGIANNLNQRGYAISERVAEDLSAKRLHISELIAMLGYTKTDITKILQAVKHKGLSIVLIGLGGTGSNFLHWLYEMAEWTGKDRIFNRISSFDDDDYDVPNMLRIPFVPQFSTTAFNSKKANNIPKRFHTLANTFTTREERLTDGMIKDTGMRRRLGARGETFIYGAPDIETREWLSASDYTFFAATHRDNEYSIVENPSVDNDLMMETYGKINLSMFFLNHLSMTIDFLEYLPTRTEDYKDQRVNETIIRSDFGDTFKDKLKDGFKAGSKKLYAIPEEGHTRDVNLPEGAV